MLLLINASDIAFIGGSLVPTGGHNILEASASGVPVIFGPHMFNFEKVTKLVLEKDAGIQIMTGEELSDVVVRLLGDPVLRDQYATRGKELIDENKGAFSKIKSLIEALVEKR